MITRSIKDGMNEKSGLTPEFLDFAIQAKFAYVNKLKRADARFFNA